MRILLLRHAEPDYSIDGLTPKGRKEAELLSRRMEKYDIRDFFVSPLGRARETAEYTLKRMGREAKVLPWLQEFRGRMINPETGKHRACWDLKPRLWTSDPKLMEPDGWADSLLFQGGNVREIWDETRQGVDALMARYGFRKDGPVWLGPDNTGDTIALFCHFGISMVILGYLTDVSPMFWLQRCAASPSALTEVVTEERIRGEVSFRVTKLGDLTHLEAAGEPRSTAGLFPECYTGVDNTVPEENGNRTPLP